MRPTRLLQRGRYAHQARQAGPGARRAGRRHTAIHGGAEGRRGLRDGGADRWNNETPPTGCDTGLAKDASSYRDEVPVGNVHRARTIAASIPVSRTSVSAVETIYLVQLEKICTTYAPLLQISPGPRHVVDCADEHLEVYCRGVQWADGSIEAEITIAAADELDRLISSLASASYSDSVGLGMYESQRRKGLCHAEETRRRYRHRGRPRVVRSWSGSRRRECRSSSPGCPRHGPQCAATGRSRRGGLVGRSRPWPWPLGARRRLGRRRLGRRLGRTRMGLGRPGCVRQCWLGLRLHRMTGEACPYTHPLGCRADCCRVDDA
jgi:hypothetical protein